MFKHFIEKNELFLVLGDERIPIVDLGITVLPKEEPKAGQCIRMEVVNGQVLATWVDND
jgi:hypothetical protein